MQFYLAITVLFCFSLVYTLYLIIYRLYLSPISHFPGRRLAALTYWYEAYFDIYRWGQYTNEIQRMHDEYGPVVRISPEEIHINDPDFYDSVYFFGTKKVNKWPRQTRMFPIEGAIFTTVDNNLHATRRAAIASSFSKRAVVQLEPTIRKYVDSLLRRFDAVKGSGQALNLFHVYAALTADIVVDYSFGQPRGFLEEPEFNKDWHELWVSLNDLNPIWRKFGNLGPLFNGLPEWLLLSITPTLLELIKFKQFLNNQLASLKEQRESGAKPTERIVFNEIYDSNLPPGELTDERLVEEGVNVVIAGMVTTASTLSITTFHLLSNQSIRSRLEKELSDNKSDSLRELEQLPYLTAVIKEGLRKSYGITQRLPRIFPDNAIKFNEWEIPPGTPISMTCPLIHDNPTIFPNPRAFTPERWLDSNGAIHDNLDKYLVAFGKGTRQCLGMHIAYAELYMTIASLFRAGRFEFDLFETDITDVEYVADMFVPAYRKESKGIRITVQ